MCITGKLNNYLYETKRYFVYKYNIIKRRVNSIINATTNAQSFLAEVRVEIRQKATR